MEKQPTLLRSIKYSIWIIDFQLLVIFKRKFRITSFRRKWIWDSIFYNSICSKIFWIFWQNIRNIYINNWLRNSKRMFLRYYDIIIWQILIAITISNWFLRKISQRNNEKCSMFNGIWIWCLWKNTLFNRWYFCSSLYHFHFRNYFICILEIRKWWNYLYKSKNCLSIFCNWNFTSLFLGVCFITWEKCFSNTIFSNIGNCMFCNYFLIIFNFQKI